MRFTNIVRYTLPAVTVALVAALISGTPSAPAFPRGGGHGGASIVLDNAAALGLSDDQVQRIEALQAKQRDAMAGKRDAMKAQHEALVRLLSADPIDRAAAEQAIDAMAKQMADNQRSRLTARLDLAEILTPDQRESLRALRREKFGQHGREGRDSSN
jgi:periplasmic protein CpxP/Spy